jgi:hypothetical protein
MARIQDGGPDDLCVKSPRIDAITGALFSTSLDPTSTTGTMITVATSNVMTAAAQLREWRMFRNSV